MTGLARVRLIGLALALGLAACDADPVPGTLTATLVSPNGPEGAAYVRLYGSGITGVSPLDGRTFAHAVGDTMHVVVVRDQPGEIRFQVAVADTTRALAALLVEVAGGDNRLRSDPANYRLELRP
jgi:hypothetical protein